CIELVRINYEITHVFTADGHGMYKVKETPEEIEALMLRDQFAMSTMSGLLSNSDGVIQANSHSGTGWVNTNAKSTAALAYEIADAMIEARESK
ncbi:MAG: hypothetical protein ACRCXK_09145, partial [Wohlfahrtiimonas sp.]